VVVASRGGGLSRLWQGNPEGFQFCGFCTAPLTGTSSEQRKTVTVLFCDVTGSTALGESTDPEALRALLARYFERMKAIVELHGGTVEKFIGDAVMAVFGVPVGHEDDALRACRAAVEMRDALPELGIRGRIGVNTGEVVTGTSERLVTGDAVNVAARLEQAAAPGTILIGEQTLRLAFGGIQVGSVEQLELKGKTEPVSVYPLVSLLDAPTRSHASRFVGRVAEIAQLADSWQRAFVGRSCELVTVVGEAGVGKSRLVAEFVGSLDVRVVRDSSGPGAEGVRRTWTADICPEVLGHGDHLICAPAADALFCVRVDHVPRAPHRHCATAWTGRSRPT
jgi:class 3 adenylate cyclase